MTATKSRWRDLSTRLASAAVLIAVTLLALKAGPVAWTVFIFAIYCTMIWELAGLCDPLWPMGRRIAIAALPMIFPVLAIIGLLFAELPLVDASSGGPRGPTLFFAGYLGAAAGLVAPLLAGLFFPSQGRRLWLSYGLILAAAALFLAYAYEAFGTWGLTILVSIVVISDTAGYFAGRALGGPKFWPSVSPKKTWSGTVAGWLCTAVFGAIMLPTAGVPPAIGALIAFVICFAAQLGDIAESAMKRRAGVKDSSALIPGHGGFLDRMDGLVAAACLAGIITLATGG